MTVTVFGYLILISLDFYNFIFPFSPWFQLLIEMIDHIFQTFSNDRKYRTMNTRNDGRTWITFKRIAKIHDSNSPRLTKATLTQFLRTFGLKSSSMFVVIGTIKAFFWKISQYVSNAPERIGLHVARVRRNKYKHVKFSTVVLEKQANTHFLFRLHLRL